MTFESFLEKLKIPLNRQQQTAVQTTEGPVLLLAVPGSGKTTVLVTRLGYMIYGKGIRPEHILTVTYTVAATRDMAERFKSMFGPEYADRLEFRTINGICAKIIAYYGRMVGKKAFDLITDEKMITGILGEIYQNVQGSFATESDLKDIRTMITYIKNMMLTEEEIAGLEEGKDIRISKIYALYNQELRRRGLMDYDDQMKYALVMLEKSPQVLRYYQEQFPYICVDEAQDTSKIQHKIIALLAKKTENLFMVGDEDQSIYGFRAAYPEALLNFEKEHPGAKVLLMEENFRSNANIVKAADRFIQKNTLRHEKHMTANRPAGAKITQIRVKTRDSQYSYLLNEARECHARTAVLYRDNESALPLADLLERNQIPYYMKNAEPGFFTSRIVTDIRNIIRFSNDPYNTELFMQIYYKMTTYLSKQNAIRACEICSQNTGSNRMTILETAAACCDLPPHISQNCKSMNTHLAHLKDDTAIKGIVRIVAYMGYGEYVDRQQMKTGKIDILKALARQEENVYTLDDRLTELERRIREHRYDPACPFILSTIHSSKGLEYDTVYILDADDGIFPEKVLNYSGNADAEEVSLYEEERRLFYVGVTRAREQLYLFRISESATFIKELTMINKSKTLERGQKQPANRKNNRYVTAQKKRPGPADKSFEEFCRELGEGVAVVHNVYGDGAVVHLASGNIWISFAQGEKKFSLKALYRLDVLRIRE